MLFAEARNSELKERFMALYEGKWYRHGIKGFITRGHKTFGRDGWAARFDTAFEQPINEQCNILAEIGEWDQS